MKKEFFAIALLAAMLIAAIFNIGGIIKLTDELTQLVGTSTEAAKAGDWYKAEKYINKAIKTWKSKDSYTHIVLRHSEIDILSDALYEYMRDVLEKNEDTATASSKKLLYHLESLAQMERLRFGSIF